MCRSNGLWEDVEYTGTSGSRNRQLASIIVSKDFVDDALTISAVSLFYKKCENAESLWATASTTFLLVEHIGLNGVSSHKFH